MMKNELTPKNVGMLIPKTKDKRIMFMCPYKNSTLIGTTDH